MKALILIGGKGTRLRPLTYTTTKSMLPVVNVPFIDRLVRRLAAHGVTEIVLAMNYLAEELKAHIDMQQTAYAAKVFYSVEPFPLGSGGAVKFNQEHLTETFLLLNGDILTDLNFTDLVRFHKEKNALVSVNVTTVEDPTRFGVVDTDRHGRILTWQEKPQREEVKSNLANVGIWVMEPEILREIPDGRPVSLEKEVFPRLAAMQAPFYAYVSSNYWTDMGTPESYSQLHWDILQGRVEEHILEKEKESGIWLGNNCVVAPSARILGPVVIGDGVRVHGDVMLVGPVVIGGGCELGPGAIVERSIIMDNVVIESNASLSSTVIARNTRIGSAVVLRNALIADDSHIEMSLPASQSYRLGPGTHLR